MRNVKEGTYLLVPLKYKKQAFIGKFWRLDEIAFEDCFSGEHSKNGILLIDAVLFDYRWELNEEVVRYGSIVENTIKSLVIGYKGMSDTKKRSIFVPYINAEYIEDITDLIQWVKIDLGGKNDRRKKRNLFAGSFKRY